MRSRIGHTVVAQLLLVPLAALQVAAGPQETAERPSCDQLPACRELKAVGIESHVKGQFGVALERLRAAYSLSQDYRLQVPIGRVLQQLGRGDEAFAAFQLFLQNAPYNHSLRPTVEKWLRELLESTSAEEAERAAAPSSPQPPPSLPPCPRAKMPLARRVSGSVLLGLGLGGLAASTALYLQHGALADGTCSFDGQMRPCFWDTRPAYTTGFVLSAASLLSGTLVLAWPMRPAGNESGGAALCRKQ